MPRESGKMTSPHPPPCGAPPAARPSPRCARRGDRDKWKAEPPEPRRTGAAACPSWLLSAQQRRRRPLRFQEFPEPVDIKSVA